MGHSDVECRSFHSMNVTDICAFVNATDDCQIDEGFINYTLFVYCHFMHLVPLGVFVLFLWWFFLFCGLAVTADDFFCPSLAVISRTLRLSHNIAGVTFLAFGNGAPDIFSAIAAIGSAKAGDAGLAIGALFGAGVFVTTVVVGAVAAVRPFDVMQRPFLRDVVFFLAAVFWSFCIMWSREITTLQAAGFILLYVVYVLVVIIGRLIYQRQRSSRSGDDCQEDESSEERRAITESEGERSPLLAPDQLSVQTDPPVEIQQAVLPVLGHREGDRGSSTQQFFWAINPFSTQDWPQLKIHTKVYQVFTCPMVFFLKLTVPVVDDDGDDMKGWNRHLNSLHCFTGPTFFVFATDLAFSKLGGVVPAFAVAMVAGAVLCFLVLCTSSNDQPPKYHALFAYLGFVVAVVWIYSVANEIVNILQTFGIALNISNAIIGLTLLAWGNSVGDFIADVAMARQGYPRMGVSACFGGPLFNVLLGIGIPFTIACIKNGGTFKLQVTLEELFLAGSVTVSLVTSLVLVPLSGFKMSRRYGLLLLALYCVFLVFALLIETNVITNFYH
ncbi:mitochondrial sodium/calcium exchanger protein-like [Babylonia areolata]|uniref:mitochondrial sodium/calcium exchanger protein-like n=1 Tax=Babylonia areolata TaxID=304850 RepID=UPI003FD1DF2B